MKPHKDKVGDLKSSLKQWREAADLILKAPMNKKGKLFHKTWPTLTDGGKAWISCYLFLKCHLDIKKFHKMYNLNL